MEEQRQIIPDKQVEPYINKTKIAEASEILQKYKKSKASLENRIIENEQWYKLRHWEVMDKSTKSEKPVTAWLFNTLANKHADAMDNYPEPNILPREEGDKAEAKMLSSILPVIFDQNDFEGTYSDVWDYKLKNGTGVYGVFWDSFKHNGLGDIAIRKVDIINLFWEPGITDIQKSRNLFHVELVANDVLEATYPQLENRLGTSSLSLSEYVYDDSVDASDKSAVVDWYYKKVVNGKTILHYVKYVNDEVLFATENDPQYIERGFYDHGKYPFVFDVLFGVEGSPAGFGYVDIGKSPQEYIDRLNQAILENALANTKPRYFINESGEVNEEEYADFNKPFIHVNGQLGQDSILPIQTTGLSSIYVSFLENKIEEMKETTGNRDVSAGSAGGVTAASAIAALQEAGSKLSRDSNKKSYRAYREIVLIAIELVRQFYNFERSFRIVGENGVHEFVSYSNEHIKPQERGVEFGVDMGSYIPLFDIEISAQKKSPYSKLSQNELALQFFGAGFFNPQMADQSLACLDMMDFDRKDFIMQKIAQNGGMFQQMMMMQQQMMAMAQQLDMLTGTQNAPLIAQQFGGGMPPMMANPGIANKAKETETLGGNGVGESKHTADARKRVADSTSPT